MASPLSFEPPFAVHTFFFPQHQRTGFFFCSFVVKFLTLNRYCIKIIIFRLSPRLASSVIFVHIIR